MTGVSKVDEIFALRGSQPVSAARTQSERQASPCAKVEELFALNGQSDALREECPEKVDRIFVLRGHPSRRTPAAVAPSTLPVRPPESAIDFSYLRTNAASPAIPTQAATSTVDDAAGKAMVVIEIQPGKAAGIHAIEKRIGRPLAAAWRERTNASGATQRVFSIGVGEERSFRYLSGPLGDGISLAVAKVDLASTDWKGAKADWLRTHRPEGASLLEARGIRDLRSAWDARR
jgi:hypothetical protein